MVQPTSAISGIGRVGGRPPERRLLVDPAPLPPRAPSPDAERARPERAHVAPGEAVAEAARFWFFGGRSPAPRRVAVPLTLGGADAVASARVLGLGPHASQPDIDRRFREIVKAQRPDLGAMRPEVLERLTGHRSRVRAAAASAARTAVAARYAEHGASSAGHTIDLTG